MRQHRSIISFALAAAALLGSSAARAQEPYSLRLSLLGGVGGSQDVDRGDGFGNTAVQAEVALRTEPGTMVGVRAGRIQLDDDEGFGTLVEADLDYLAVGGEYRFLEGFYESGLFLGLGGYRLRGDRAADGDEEETALGAQLGVSGDFLLTRRLALRIELTGHYADLEEASLFGTALAGLSLRF